MLTWDLKYVFSYVPIGLLFIAFILLNSHQTYTFYTVTKETIPLTMTFTGVVKPLKMMQVYSPIDGIITKINVKFGSNVKKGQLLFSLSSQSLQSTLRSTINSYLRAKSDLESNTFQNTGNTALFKAGLISKVEYQNSESQYETAKLTLWDATETLKTTFAGTGLNEKQLEYLTLKDVDKIKNIIASAQQLNIFSPGEGILSTQNNIGGSNKELTVGTIIKQGDIIAIIYEMNGLNFTVNIVETQLEQISVGQKATVTGIAFPSVTLEGYVNSMNQEANTDSGTTPTYTIRIIVPKITPSQRSLIKTGMSAIITLIKNRPPTIRIPLNALIHGEGVYSVKKFNPVNGEIKEVSVETGDTDETSVEITSGLSEGDIVVIPD